MADKQHDHGLLQMQGRIRGKKELFSFLMGKQKKLSTKERKFFELTIHGKLEALSNSLFSSFKSDSHLNDSSGDVDEQPQTFPQWKVQTDFRRLNWWQRKRMRQKAIYILPVGPFPDFVHKAVRGSKWTLFELIQQFLSLYFVGMSVQTLEPVDILDLKCKTRVHHLTKQRQVLVGDVHKYLKETLPKDGYCILGVTWVDLYPTESLNFILGEAQCNDGCAAVCFGHFEPQKYSDCDIMSKGTSKCVQSNPEQDSKLDTNASRASLGKSLIDKAEPRCHAAQQMSAENKLMIADHLIGNFKCIAHSTSEQCASSVADETLNESSPVDRKLCSCGICPQESKYLKNDDGDDDDDDFDDSACFRSFGSIDKVDGELIWRMFRAISHELCHLFGMAHCWYFSCAMNSSSSIQQAESQPLFLCPVCLRKLQKALGFCLLSRYNALVKFFTSLYDDLHRQEHLSLCDVKSALQGMDGRLSNNRDTIARGNHLRELIEWLSRVISFIHSDCDY